MSLEYIAGSRQNAWQANGMEDWIFRSPQYFFYVPNPAAIKGHLDYSFFHPVFTGIIAIVHLKIFLHLLHRNAG